MPVPPTFEARVVENRPLTPGVRELTFERAAGDPFEFEAGQWVSLVLPLPSGELRRSYSIASPPSAGSPRFQIAVTHVEGGPGSSFLHGLTLGDRLRVIGPQGFFTRPLEGAGPALFVATGTGVTPLRSMLHAAIARGHTAPITLVLGVRREEDLLYGDELTELARAHAGRVRFEPTLSRGDEAWSGRRGYVQTHVRELWDDLVARCGGAAPHAYVCGLQKMVGTVRDLLRKDMQVTRQQVHSERYD